MRDAAFCSASSSLAMLRFGGVATGAVAGSVAEGLAQALKASVQKGQELRRGQGPFSKKDIILESITHRHIYIT